jgi:hypothetical protein
MSLLAQLVIALLVFVPALTNPSPAQETNFPVLSPEKILPEELRIVEVWEIAGAVRVNAGPSVRSNGTTAPRFVIICDRGNRDNALFIIQDRENLTDDRMVVPPGYCDGFRRAVHERASAQGVEVKTGIPNSAK